MSLMRNILMLFFLCIVSVTNAQLDTLDLAQPLNFEMVLTGNFAEPRSVHFHSGIDIRTYGEGKALHSVDDAYVSRINISPWGYGRGIYLTHSNGYTSVYGHMSRYAEPLATYINNLQYALQSYAIDTVLPKDLFVLKKGEVFGYSGNTGQSAGPHLHFELRDNKTEHPVNVLNTVYKVKDNLPPEIKSLIVYSHGSGKTYVLADKKVKGSSGKYSLADILIDLPQNEYLGFGVEYVDKMNNTYNKFGIQELKLWVNDSLYYHSYISELDFKKQKQKNSFFDFAYYLNHKRNVHKCFIEPNNDLEVYLAEINNAWYNPLGETKIVVKAELVDFNGNISVLNFNIQPNLTDNKKQCDYLHWDKSYVLLAGNARVEIDSSCLFDDVPLDFKFVDEGKLSSVYMLEPVDIALKYPVKISLRIDENANVDRDKMFIACVRKGRLRFLYAKEEYDYLTVYTRVLGKYYIASDTTPPKITSVNLSNGGNMTGVKSIKIKMSDNLSGIAEYNGYIDDTWVLFKYEPKTSIVSYKFDKHMPIGSSHTLRFVVTDRLGNTSSLERTFTR